MTNDNIAIDVMKAMYVANLTYRNKQKTLLDRMIASGKLMYYLDEIFI